VKTGGVLGVLINVISEKGAAAEDVLQDVVLRLIVARIDFHSVTPSTRDLFRACDRLEVQEQESLIFSLLRRCDRVLRRLRVLVTQCAD
jgi:hypothetical protein